MKKLFKRLFIFVCAFLCVLAVGCTNAADVLKNYIFETDGQTVANDFELPYQIAGKNVTWESNHSEVVSIEKVKNDDYIAHVTIPETKTTVTLTVSLGSESRDFTVIVNPINVNAIGNAYTFSKNRSVVTANFELDTTTTYKGKMASIEWSVADGGDYCSIVDEGEKKICKINQSSLNPTVRLNAKFTFDGQEYTKQYYFTVSITRDAGELVDYFYQKGNTTSVTGYVLGFGEEYPNTYNNALIYLLDENYKAGYYLYRTTISEADKENMVVGSKITVSNVVTTDYNGLFESNSGTGTVTLCKDAEGNFIRDENVLSHVYALDEEILGNLPSTKYHESQYVSLSAWKVKEVLEDPTKESFKTNVLVTLEKTIGEGENAKTVEVGLDVSKYCWGWYTGFDDAKCQAIIAKKNTLNVGDYVNVKGMLTRYTTDAQGNNDGFQLYMISADDIEVTTAEAAETVHVGPVAGEAYAANVAALQTAGIISAKGAANLIVENKQFTLPTTFGEGGTIEYVIKGSSNAVTINNGEFTVVPQSNEENAHIQVIYKIGGREFVQYFYIHSVCKTDAEIAAYEAARVKISGSFVSGKAVVVNDEVKPVLFSNATYKFAAVEEYKDYYTISADGLSLVPQPVDEETTVKVKVVAVSGTETAEKEVNLKITVRTFSQASSDPVAAADVDVTKEYILGFNNGTTVRFATGNMSGNYGESTTSLGSTAKVTVTAVADKENTYNIKVGDKFLNCTISGTYLKWTYDATANTEWNYADGYFYTTNKVDDTTTQTIWAGSNGSYGTFGVYDESKKAHNASGNYPAALYELVVDNSNTEQRATHEAENVKVNGGKVLDKGSEYTLVTAGDKYDDVTLSYAIKNAEDAAWITIAGDKLTVIQDGSDYKDVVLTVTGKCGQTTVNKEVTVKINVATTYATSVEAVYNLGQSVSANNKLYAGKVQVAGFVTQVDSKIFIGDSADDTTKTVQLYQYTNANLKVGDYVVIKGDVTKYNTTSQFVGSTVTLVEHVELTSLADVKAAGDALTNNAYLAKEMLTTGVVKSIANAGAYNLAIWLTDGTNEVEVYGYLATDTKVAAADIKVGDIITVKGYVQRYNTTVEFKANTVDSVKVYPNVLLRTENAANAALVNALKADELKVEQIIATGDIDLPTTVEGSTVAIAWTLAESDIATLDGAKLTVNAVTAQAAGLNLTAKLTNADATISFEVPVSVVVKEANFAMANVSYATSVDTAKKYIIGVDQGNLNQVLYFTGAKTGNYGVSSIYSYEAAIVEFVAVEGGYNIKMTLPTGEEKYFNVGTDHYLAIGDTASTVFTYDETTNSIQTVVGSDTYYMGSYSANTTFSFSKTSYMTSAGNFTAHIYEFTSETTLAGKADYDAVRDAMKKAIEVLPTANVAKATDIALYTDAKATVVYTVVEGSACASIADGTLAITLPAADTTVKVKVAVTAGSYSYERTFSFVVQDPTPKISYSFSTIDTVTKLANGTAIPEDTTATIGGMDFKFNNCKAYTGYLMLCSGTASVYNTVAVQGKIVKVVITTGSGASTTAKYGCLFGTAAITAADATVANAVTGGKSTTHTFTPADANCTYFAVCSGNTGVNAQIASIVVYYNAD